MSKGVEKRTLPYGCPFFYFSIHLLLTLIITTQNLLHHCTTRVVLGCIVLFLRSISSWWTTLFALTIEDSLDVAVSFLIVFQFWRLLCVMLVVVMVSSHMIIFLSVILSSSMVPDSTSLLLKGLFIYCFLYRYSLIPHVHTLQMIVVSLDGFMVVNEIVEFR